MLAQFIREKKYKRAIDIGSGSGVLALYVAKILECSHVDAIEIQPELFECLVKTVEINALSEVIHTYEGDVKEFRTTTQYDLIVCNPPYRETNRGRISQNKMKEHARFSRFLNIDDIFTFALKYLKNSGSLYMSYDVDFMIDVVENSRKYKLELKRMKFLHSEINKVAKLVFMEFRKNVGKELIVEPPFIQKY